MKWKCKNSGNIIELFTEHDDEIMKGHDGYELVEEPKVEPEPKKPTKAPKE
jgi:hypothetical protein